MACADWWYGGSQGTLLLRMVGLVAVLVWDARWETLAGHICCVEGGVQYVPGLGVSLIVAAKHHVIGEPALATMFVGLSDDQPHVAQHVSNSFRVGFRYYGYISNKGGNPRDKRPDLSQFCLLGLLAKASGECLQSLC